MGTALALISLSYTSTFPGALFSMAIAVACCGFHNSGILVNPQDIAPKHAGSVFGKLDFKCDQFLGYIQFDLSNSTQQEMCRIVQDVGILKFYFN